MSRKNLDAWISLMWRIDDRGGEVSCHLKEKTSSGEKEQRGVVPAVGRARNECDVWREDS